MNIFYLYWQPVSRYGETGSLVIDDESVYDPCFLLPLFQYIAIFKYINIFYVQYTVFSFSLPFPPPSLPPFSPSLPSSFLPLPPLPSLSPSLPLYHSISSRLFIVYQKRITLIHHYSYQFNVCTHEKKLPTTTSHCSIIISLTATGSLRNLRYKQ